MTWQIVVLSGLILAYAAFMSWCGVRKHEAEYVHNTECFKALVEQGIDPRSSPAER